MKSAQIMAFVMASLGYLAMAQDPPAPTPTEVGPNLLLTNANIGFWIQPNLLFGILFMLAFTGFFCFGLRELASIQTPTMYREKTLNWGKVEEFE